MLVLRREDFDPQSVSIEALDTLSPDDLIGGDLDLDLDFDPSIYPFQNADQSLLTSFEPTALDFAGCHLSSCDGALAQNYATTHRFSDSTLETGDGLMLTTGIDR